MEQCRWTQQLPRELLDLLLKHLTRGVCFELKELSEFAAYDSVRRATALDALRGAAEGGYLDLMARYQSAAPTRYMQECVTAAAAEKGHVEVLEWARARNWRIGGLAWGAAAEKMQENVLQWLLDHRVPDSHADGCFFAALAGNVEALEWLGRDPYRINPDHIFYAAGSRGHLQVLEWCHSYGLLIYQSASVEAAHNGHHEVVDWMFQQGYRHGSDISTRTVAERGHLEVLKVLKKNGELVCHPWDMRYVMQGVAKGGQIAVLQWLVAEGAICDVWVWRMALMGGQLNMLKFLYAGRLGSDDVDDTILWAMEYSGLEILQWLRGVGCWSPKASDYARSHSRKGVIEWMKQEGLYVAQ